MKEGRVDDWFEREGWLGSVEEVEGLRESAVFQEVEDLGVRGEESVVLIQGESVEVVVEVLHQTFSEKLRRFCSMVKEKFSVSFFLCIKIIVKLLECSQIFQINK